VRRGGKGGGGTYGIKGEIETDDDDEGAEPYCPRGAGKCHGLS
jgi:hypothetical protein